MKKKYIIHREDLLSFEEAINCILKGEKVTRIKWNDIEKYIFKNIDESCIKIRNGKIYHTRSQYRIDMYDNETIYMSWVPLEEDTEATDWFCLKDIKKES